VDYDVIIVGAGASGLMAAITVARQGSSVLVIERKDKAGKKILATGNGKCNYTNMIQKPECYRSDDSAFAMKVLSCFDVSQTIEFFEELGIYPKERDGYLYPNSEQAASVVQVLLLECKRLKIHFQYEESVIDIVQPNYTVITEKIIYEENNKGLFDSKNKVFDSKNKLYESKNKPIDSKNKRYDNQNNSVDNNSKMSDNKTKTGKQIAEIKQQTYYGTKLILTAGGCASPQLGSDGSGYTLAKNFGHTIIKPLPALVQLKSQEKYCKTVSGVRTTAEVTVFADNKQIAKEEGEILFTDYGISGIPVMQVSRFVSKALDTGANIYLLIDFFPALPKEKLFKMLLQRIQQNPDKNMEEMMVGLLNHKLSYSIITEIKFDPYKAVKKISKEEVEVLMNQLKNFRMMISGTNSFENAQVCAGGVSTKEIDANTMESKLSKNLFLAGELLDVDGTCGGYNLQWAWTSGYLAGKIAGRKNNS
jgi:predicted Rossmann fold flavoprotein